MYVCGHVVSVPRLSGSARRAYHRYEICHIGDCHLQLEEAVKMFKQD
jgi:hypothetical protein